VYFESSHRRGAERENPAFRYAVSPGYIEAMHIPLRRGRLLNVRDAAGAPLVVLISESLARRRFYAHDPIGKRIHVGPESWPYATIVGVVGDVKQTSLAIDQPDAFYMTIAQGWFADSKMSLVVRAHGASAAFSAAIKDAIWKVDKDQPIVRVLSMEALRAASEAGRRFVLILFEAFGIGALALAATGIFGVLSGSVTERAREIGVRSALGASRKNVLALVLRQGMTLTAIGGIIGLSIAAGATKGIVALLFGVSRLDPITYGGVMALLVVVSAVACALPAWRAARVDPSVALRAE
jgi:putative ABC transport system permease protein